MEAKILKVTFTEEYKFDLMRVLFNELNIKFEDYEESVILIHTEDILEDVEEVLPGKAELEILKQTVTRRRKKIVSTNFKNSNVWFAKKTIEQVLNAIKIRQQKFIETGLKKDIVPMIYRDVATDVGRDISTIARIAERKRCHVNGELISFKEFFKEGSLYTKDGRMVTQYEFFDLIIEIIESENKLKPLTDEFIALELEQRGYLIARRTVAKYRDEFLNIPNSNERRGKK